MTDKRPLRVMIISLFPLSDEGEDTLSEWLSFWFPRDYPVQLFRLYAARTTKEEWQKWMEQRSYDWYLMLGVATANQITQYGGFPYGVFKTVVPHPQIQFASLPLAHTEIADLCRNLCRWNSMREKPAPEQPGGTVISLFRSRRPTDGA